MIKLLPRKSFEIHYEGKVIPGKFGTWCWSRMCQLKGGTLDDLQARLAAPSISDVLEIILCAVEQAAREQGIPFSYTDVHVGMWLDVYGGIGSEEVAKLLKHMTSELVPSEGSEEKKST